MENQITTIDENQSITLQQSEIIPTEQYELVKRMYAKGSSEDEFQVFIRLANKYRLDPFLKQIWCIKRSEKDPSLIMTSRDGYMAIAHRARTDDGQKAFDGIESGTIKEGGKLVKAWAKVYRKDMSRPFSTEVDYDEYKSTVSPVWTKYPSAMLIKTAEVMALRKAFDIAGIVAEEETDRELSQAPAYLPSQKGNEAIQNLKSRINTKAESKGVEVEYSNPVPEAAESEQESDKEKTTNQYLEKKRREFFAVAAQAGLDPEKAKEAAKRKYEVDSFMDMSGGQLHLAITAIKANPKYADKFAG